MANRQLLQDIQKRQRQLRLESINPDKVAEVMRIKESYVKQDDLERFKDSITRLLATLSNELDNLKLDSQTTITDTKKSLWRTLSSETSRIRSEFASKIKSIEAELGTSFDDIERIKASGGTVPKGLIEEINRFVVQRSVSIPVTIDQGGTGATTAAQARANLGITTGGGSGITRSITVTSGNITAGETVDVDYVYLVAGAHTITLPTAVSNTNRYTIKNNHSVNITVNTTSSQTIDGTTTISLAPEESVDIISTDTNWSII